MSWGGFFWTAGLNFYSVDDSSRTMLPKLEPGYFFGPNETGQKFVPEPFEAFLTVNNHQSQSLRLIDNRSQGSGKKTFEWVVGAVSSWSEEAINWRACRLLLSLIDKAYWSLIKRQLLNKMSVALSWCSFGHQGIFNLCSVSVTQRHATNELLLRLEIQMLGDHSVELCESGLRASI